LNLRIQTDESGAVSVAREFIRGRANPAAFLLIAIALSLAIALLPLQQVGLIGLALIAAITLLAIFAEPTLGLAALIVIAPFTPYAKINLDPRLDTGQILFGIWLAAYLLRALFFRRRETQSPLISSSPHLLIPLILFILIATLSFFPAISFKDWLEETSKWVVILVLYLVVANEHDPHKRKIIIGAILFSAAFQGIVGLIEYTRGYGPPEFNVPGTRFYRAYGTFEQPNPFGGYMGLVWPFVAGVALVCWRTWQKGSRGAEEKGRKQNLPLSPASLLVPAVLVSLIALLALSGVITSGSRGARLGMFAAIAAMVLALLPKPGRIVGGVVLMGLAAFALNLIPQSLYAQADSFLNEYGSFDVRGIYLTKVNFSNVERIAHWQVGLDMMRDHPWLGVGFGNYEPMYAQYRLLYWVNALGHAHNYYINIFAETGVFGFITYVILWAAIFVRTWRKRHSLLAVGLLGTWVHLTVHHFVDNLYVANNFILIGVLLGLLESDSNPNSPSPPRAPHSHPRSASPTAPAPCQ
jgi:putative inorganic carbon (hco3(-)) transporter